MRLAGKTIRGRSSFESSLWLYACLLFLLIFCATTQQTAGAQQQRKVSAVNSPLTTDQVVEKLVGMNFRRAQALHSYHGTRTYRVEYRSFHSTVSAEMVVDVMYLAPETKDFTIQPSTGSKLIIDKVFTKILQAEKDAQSTDAQRRTALSRENYEFTMGGFESTPSQSMYVLVVEPKTKSKFLFRGRVWVDADDFAVVRLEAEPAKNPSFWTKNSEIEQSYVKVNDFWLPERNHSISSIRLGGRAELTIEYRNYRITAADSVGSAPEQEIARSADTSRTLDCRQTSLRHAAEAGLCLSSASSVSNEHYLPNRSPMLPEPQAAATEGGSWQNERR
jgi:hypothetical protein